MENFAAAKIYGAHKFMTASFMVVFIGFEQKKMATKNYEQMSVVQKVRHDSTFNMTAAEYGRKIFFSLILPLVLSFYWW